MHVSGQDANNVLRGGSVRDNLAVCTWTTVTTGFDKHADKKAHQKNVCAVGVLFTDVGHESQVPCWFVRQNHPREYWPQHAQHGMDRFIVACLVRY